MALPDPDTMFKQVDQNLAADALDAFANHYEAIHAGVHEAAADAPADYWRGANDAVGHVIASLRARAGFLREGNGHG